jgi:hypothetical protein
VNTVGDLVWRCLCRGVAEQQTVKLCMTLRDHAAQVCHTGVRGYVQVGGRTGEAQMVTEAL